jgi:predicted small lipoprotein YifL
MATKTLIAVGAAVALMLLITAVWVSDVSTPAGLTLTALLILIAVAALGMNATRGPGERPPHETVADQRDRMRDKVP